MEQVLSRDHWLPDIRIRESVSGLIYEQAGTDGWQRLPADAAALSSPFASVALLLPNSACSFCSRRFPADMISAKDLDEAVALDLQQWNPFDVAVAWLSFFERVEDEWRVAVWIWPQAEEDRLLQQLPDTVRCTHVMPEMACFACRIQADRPVLLIAAEAGHGEIWALVAGSGVPLAISQIADQAAAHRFWRACANRDGEVKQALLCYEADNIWTPSELSVGGGDWRRVRHTLLARARRQGVRDWRNPLGWRKQLLTLGSLLLIWMAADALVLVQRLDRVDTQLARQSQGAGVVLGYRDRVTHIDQYLRRFADLRAQQYQPQRLLAELTRTIPKDIWLSIMQFGDGWVDLRGQGRNVIRLVVLLEKIDGVKQALLLNDIRPNARTGLESFQLRLVLDDKSIAALQPGGDEE